MKKAFSLIELMIVIVIIGVIYTLAVSKLQNFDKEKLTPTLANLKEYLQSYIKNDVKEVKLLCLDTCESCNVYVDGMKQQTNIEPFFDATVELYRYDFLQGLVKKEPAAFFTKEGRQEDVCFSFSMGKDIVNEQLIAVYKEKAYDYTSYFTATKVYEHIEELVEAKENLVQEVAR